MPRVVVATTIHATPEMVWSDVADIASHVAWMADARAIRFRGEPRRGVGTSFECDTAVGPLRLTDVMTITEWRPEAVMGVRHTGIVTGEGRFTLEPGPGGVTVFRWEEELSFPWWMGGPVGAAVGSLVLRRIWAGNLRRLKERLERRHVG